MPSRSSTDRDFAVTAFQVVEKAIGEHMDGTPLKPIAVKSKRVASGKAGGPARAKSLSAEQRRQIAVKAARARWTKRGDD
jgi:hypothetical protein